MEKLWKIPGSSLPDCENCLKNCCRFCCNTVFNAVPTMLYDLTEEIRSVGASSYRYEFTVETAEEVHGILSGTLRPGAFTRGHFKKSVL